jgi:hypothetical protein
MVRSWAAVGAAALVALPLTSTAAAMASAQPVAHAATGCKLGSSYDKLGPTYVEVLNVSNTNCATGFKVIKAYNKCRLSAGGVKGYCHARVLGFSCSEGPRTKSPIQFIAKAQCKSGRKVVKFTYTEFD